MWHLYLTAKTSRSRPSDIVGIIDRWAAFQLDSAVTLVGNAIEGASQEMQKIGGDKNARYVPKYNMEELMDPAFRLPRPPTKKDRERSSLATLRRLAGSKNSGVKVFKGKDK